MESSVSTYRLREGWSSLVIPAGSSTGYDEIIGLDQEAHKPEEMENVDDDNGLNEVSALEVSKWPLFVLCDRVSHWVVAECFQDPYC